MDVARSANLLDVLAVSFDKIDGTRTGHPSGLVARSRARGIAEMEALRRFERTGSAEDALRLGIQAYERELRYFNPLSLLHETEQIEQTEERAIGAEG